MPVFVAVYLGLFPLHEPVAKWCAIAREEPLKNGSDSRLAAVLKGNHAPTVLCVDLHR